MWVYTTLRFYLYFYYIWHEIKVLFILSFCTYICVSSFPSFINLRSILFSFLHFVLSYPYLFLLTRAHYSQSASASALLRSSLKLGPSSVTSAISSAWLWRNLFKSTGHCTEWFPLIYICLTLWLTEPISLSWPWRRTDTHLQVRWGGMSLIDWQTVTEPLGHYKTISAQHESNIMLVYECVRIDAFAWVCMYGCVCECGWSAL